MKREFDSRFPYRINEKFPGRTTRGTFRPGNFYNPAAVFRLFERRKFHTAEFDGAAFALQTDIALVIRHAGNPVLQLAVDINRHRTIVADHLGAVPLPDRLFVRAFILVTIISVESARYSAQSAPPN